MSNYTLKIMIFVNMLNLLRNVVKKKKKKEKHSLPMTVLFNISSNIKTILLIYMTNMSLASHKTVTL